MIRKIYIDKVTDALIAFVGKIDSIAESRARTLINIANEAEKMQGRYTEAYIREYVKNYNFPDYRQQMNTARTASKSIIDGFIDTIGKELDSYFTAPVRQDFANKITSIKLTGLKLSNREFETLAKDAKSYMEMRLINQLAETRTKTEMKVSLDPETREPKREKTETVAPYNYIDVPDLDACYSSFENYKKNVYRLLNGYSGKNADLHEFLENEMPKNISLTSDSYFRNRTGDKFKDFMEKQGQILNKASLKTSLTEKDKKLIDAIINEPFPQYHQDSIRGRIRTISELMPEIGALIKLDDRYSEYTED